MYTIVWPRQTTKQRVMVTGKYCITWRDGLCAELKGRSVSLSLLLFLYNFTLLLTYQHFLAIGIVATFLLSRPDLSLYLKIYVVLWHFLPAVYIQGGTWRGVSREKMGVSGVNMGVSL
jgi:hypothetical protein